VTALPGFAVGTSGGAVQKHQRAGPTLEGDLMAGTVEDLRVRVENLVRTADHQALHPIDWYRFYEIIIYAVQEDLDKQFNAADLTRFLKKLGINQEIIDQLTFMYSRGGDLLRYYFSVSCMS
jgi:hypothetical protein